MRRLIIFLIFVFPINLSSCSSNNDELLVDEKEEPCAEVIDPYKDIKEWFDYLCSPELEGRYSGSEGINKAVLYISEIIGRSDSLEIDHFVTYKCEMNNIIFHIKGDKDSLIVLGAHYDAYGYINKSPLPGADDNMSGVAVLLKLIKYLQNGYHPNYSIDICFFDGEEIGRFGSSRYLTHCKYGIKKYINVDTCGNKDKGVMILYDGKSPSLEEESEYIFSLMDDINKWTAKVYNPKGFTTDCEPFEKKDIPFMSIQNDSGSNYIHSINDDISHISFSRLDNLARGLNIYLRSI